MGEKSKNQFGGKGATFAAASLSLLDNAEEQCRQVLISWQDILNQGEETTPDDAPVYEALAHLAQIFNQRAILARLRGQDSNALRERILAAYLCQKALNTLDEPALLWTLVQEMLSIWPDRTYSDSPPLPHLHALSQDAPTFHPRLIGQVEMYCAAAEAAEELGRTGASSDYRHDCYRQADRCYHTALALAHTIVSARERDPGYLVRYHQRYAYLLEERLADSPEDREETVSTLLALLKDRLSQIQNAVIPG